MALRILLADDSSDIRKSIVVSLQDYGAEVRAVTDGADVLSVARDFRPDLILCDTVLPKKDGFAVCKELKTDSSLKSIPVVLIYSGFVGLQKEKLVEAGANATLEKPFEAEQLRKLVNQLVNKTANQKISEFLTFPKVAPIGASHAKLPGDIPQQISATNAEEEFEDFAQVPLAKSITPQAPAPKSGQDPFDIQIPDDIYVTDLTGVEVIEAEDFDSAPIKTSTPNRASYEDEDDFEIGGLELKPEPPQVTATKPVTPPSRPSASKPPLQDRIQQAKTQPMASPVSPPQITPNMGSQGPAKTAGSLLQLDPAHLEKLLESHIKQSIESALWKVLPEIAERVIREELQRLLREVEKDV